MSSLTVLFCFMFHLVCHLGSPLFGEGRVCEARFLPPLRYLHALLPARGLRGGRFRATRFGECLFEHFPYNGFMGTSTQVIAESTKETRSGSQDPGVAENHFLLQAAMPIQNGLCA